MTFLRSSSLVLTSVAILACSDDKGSVTPTSGNVAAATVSAGQGGEGGATTTGGGGAPGTGGEDAQSSASTGGGDQASTATTVGQGGAGGSGGAGGAGGSGGAGGGGGGLPFQCINDELDDGETDVDCGGDICPPCEAEQACVDPDDCVDGICTESVCVLGNCDDDVVNQDETDEDCGGLTCVPCGFGQGCLEGTDCEEGVCTGGFCANPSCDDDVQNGEETGEDCGGGCEPCIAGLGCLEPEDCVSGVCTLEICQPATCDDGVTNGGESDVDCGGNGCNDCGAGKACVDDGNCLSGDCDNEDDVCLCPSGMTTVPIPGGGSYCIDPAEVTYAEYNAFVTANPPFNVAVCEFNIGGYTPTSLWPPDTNTPTADNYIRRPVRFVDWCDAAAYCSWRGKRLCGAIEGGPSTDLVDATEDQWFNACTAGGTNTYPYSGVFNGSQCTESVDGATGAPVSVRDTNGTLLIQCEGGYSVIYGMSGNVAEWGDSCSGSLGAADDCVVRGGSYLSTDAATLTCAASELFDRSTKAADIGFRCCQ